MQPLTPLTLPLTAGFLCHGGLHSHPPAMLHHKSVLQFFSCSLPWHLPHATGQAAPCAVALREHFSHLSPPSATGPDGRPRRATESNVPRKPRRKLQSFDDAWGGEEEEDAVAAANE